MLSETLAPLPKLGVDVFLTFDLLIAITVFAFLHAGEVAQAWWTKHYSCCQSLLCVNLESLALIFCEPFLY